VLACDLATVGMMQQRIGFIHALAALRVSHICAPSDV
jgi:hypothetical protein